MIIVIKVAVTIMEAILEVFGSIKTVMIELFHNCYAVVTKIVVATATMVIVIARP